MWVAHNNDDLQNMDKRFSSAASNFGLKINVTKTEVMYQPAPDDLYDASDITTDDTTIKTVDKYIYHSSVLIHTCIQNAIAAYSHLHDHAWKQHRIRL